MVCKFLVLACLDPLKILMNVKLVLLLLKDASADDRAMVGCSLKVCKNVGENEAHLNGAFVFLKSCDMLFLQVLLERIYYLLKRLYLYCRIHIYVAEGTKGELKYLIYRPYHNAKLGVANIIYLNGDYVIENIKIVSELANFFITCNYNNVTFGDGIECSLASGITTYPLILVGYNVGLGGPYIEDITMTGECSIVVNSGTWVYIRGGNRRANTAYPNASSSADAVLNITINGGTFTNTATNLTAGTGMGGFAGTLNFTINGGNFKGAVYAVGRSGGNTSPTSAVMSGTVNMVVRGGTFASTISAVQNDGTTKVTGKIYLTVTEALRSKAVGFDNITVE